MEYNRMQFFDIAKDIAIAWVVFHHTILFIGAYDTGWSINFAPYTILMGAMKPFALPAFFFISGYLSQKYLDMGWKTFLRRRILPIAYIYVLWSIIRWCYYAFVQTNMRTPSEGETPLQMLNIFMIPLGEMWFLWALMAALIFIKAIHVFPNPIKLGIIAALTLLPILTFAKILSFEVFAYTGLCYYAIFTAFGAYTPKTMIDSIQDKSLLFTLITVPLFLALSVLQLYIDAVPYGLARLICCCVGITMLFAISIQISKLRFVNDLLTYLGRNSLHIYIIHPMVISAFAALMITAQTYNAPLLNIWAVPFVTLSSIVIPLALKYGLERFRAGFLFRIPIKA